MTQEQIETLELRISGYLAGCGLFNPEMAKHDAVRDLVIDLRLLLSEAKAAATLRTQNAELMERVARQAEALATVARMLGL